MSSIPTRAELKRLVEQVEALHDRIPEGTCAREFILHALCSLNGAMSHLLSGISRTENGQREKNMSNRQALEAKFGKVWSEEELAQEFVVTAIIAPHVVARRKADNVVGTLEFTGQFYFNWKPQEVSK